MPPLHDLAQEAARAQVEASQLCSACMVGCSGTGVVSFFAAISSDVVRSDCVEYGEYVTVNALSDLWLAG